MIQNLLNTQNIYFFEDRVDVLNSITSSKPNSFKFESHTGQFADIHEDIDSYYLVRDPLGINKLFYSVNQVDFTITISNNAYNLGIKTGNFDSVLSVPAGHFLRVDKKSRERQLKCYYDMSSIKLPAFDLSLFHKNIESKLNDTFKAIGKKFKGSQFVVCLSGGLDSSLIAYYASRFLPGSVAATFSFPNLSEDYHAASSIAQKLELPFVPIIANRDFDLSTLSEVLKQGQDWRDFNVHCAWVNRLLAKGIRKKFPNEPVVVLTGDLMNEFVADYAPVEFDHKIYYELPKISKSRFRQFLMYGLDSGDREIGIFGAENITVVQPYCVLVEDYLGVPDSLIETPNCKEVLNQAILKAPGVLDFIHKKKLRAQVGGKDGGALGLFHNSGISQIEIKKIWNQIYGEKPFIEAGLYRH